ncbi:MAG: restriction endonuclease subunit S, partial [Truepera sp.]|nr:restriction endonuclease subunit S [Truepera sp.]
MANQLDLPHRYRQHLETLLRKHLPTVEVWAYGSRVKGQSHDGSDLDLVLRSPDLQPIPADSLASFSEALQESPIPFLIAAHDWARLPESCHPEIEREHVVLVAADGRPLDQQNSGMGGKWRELCWGDLATLEYGRALRGHNSRTGPIRVFGTNGPIGWHDEALCSYPSVVIGRKGAYRGVHYSAEPFFVIDTAFYLKPKVELDTRWAYYQLLTQDINGLDSGSAIPSTRREDFYNLPVQVPPLSEQRTIAQILGTLDDKIELNRQLNETLEELARAIFKDWFVDFGPVRAKLEGRDTGLPEHLAELFPDRLVESELGEIPEGW